MSEKGQLWKVKTKDSDYSKQCSRLWKNWTKDRGEGEMGAQGLSFS